MSETVSDVLMKRQGNGRGYRSALASSFAVHLVALGGLFVFQQYAHAHQPPKPKLMTISLGGNSNAPKTTGMSSAGARPVEEVKPPPKRLEPIPVASTPKSNVMALPVKPEPKREKPEETSKPLPVTPMPKPTTGAQVQQGTSKVETGSKGTDTGLTVGGKGGSAAAIDVPLDPYLKAYLADMVSRIEQVWASNVPERGEVVIRFSVHRDGRVEVLNTEKATSMFLENRSLKALHDVRLAPLPQEFKDEHLVIHLTFPYGK